MISIIILNYKRYDLLQNSLKSLIVQSKNIYEIIIIDNKSDRNYKLGDEFCYSSLISLPTNQGFSRAVNIGIKQAKGDYIAVLNNDTEVDPHWIENVILAFEQNPNVMYITSKIKSLKNKEVFDDVGDVILPSGKAYKIGNGEIDVGQYNQQQFVFGASGCASVYRREFFEKVGYFDEDFFAYLEDIDLSFRANLMGLKCLYIPEAVVYHVGSATTGSKYNKFTVFHLAQNTLNVIIKNYPTKFIIMYLPQMIWHIFSLQCFFTLKGLGVDFFKGFISGIKMSKFMIAKRKDIMKNKNISDEALKQLFRENKIIYDISKGNRKR